MGIKVTLNDVNMDTSRLITDFIEICKLSKIALRAEEVETVVLEAGEKHIPPKLPSEKIAVYIFINSYNGDCYKVGKAGQGTKNRYQYQHYLINKTPSTLAKSLILNPPDNVTLPLPKDIQKWIRENTTRTNFLIPLEKGDLVLNLFEAFVQTQLKPKYEGH